MTAPQLTVYIQGQGTVSADGLNTFESTADVFSQLRAFIGAVGVQVFARGQTAVNDGLGGVFYWNAAGTGPDDNFSNIVPTGAAVGCWTRLTTPSSSAIARSFTSVVAMRAASVTTGNIGTIVLLEGYYAPADGGEGFFYVTGTNPGTDNGGTIIYSNTSGFYYVRLTNGLPLSIEWFGARGDNINDSTAAISSVITTLTTNGGTMWVPVGSFVDHGTRTLPPKVSITGSGIGSSIIRSTITSGVQFDMPASSESAVDFGGNYIHGVTFQGSGTGGTNICFRIKNKTNIIFDGAEIDNYQYLIQGLRDDPLNSCTDITITSMRLGACQTAVYAPINWNGLSITNSTSLSGFTSWAVIAYDSEAVEIGASVTFDGNTAGSAGHVFFGGCNAFSLGGYYEGNLGADHFIGIASQKDVTGSATNNGIAIGTTRGGGIRSARASSAGGVAYVVQLDGTQSVVCESSRAESGISTAFARLTTNTRGNTFIGCYPNSGTVVSFQTAADQDFNNVGDYASGSLPGFGNTYTPVVTGSTGAGVGTYTTQIGTYTRIANWLVVNITLVWSAHTGTGNIRISIPGSFTAAQLCTMAVRAGALAAGNTTAIQAYIAATGAVIIPEHYAAGVATEVPLASTGNISLTGWIQIA